MTRCARAARRAGAAFALAAVAGCGALPHDRPSDDPTKRAVTSAQAASVLAQYSLIRADSATTADVGQLADAEAGSLLRIEAAIYTAAKALAVAPGAAALSQQKYVWAGSFTRYPLWFAAVADAPAEKTQVAAVFVRKTSTDPWRAVMAPRLAADTEVPAVGSGSDAAALLLTGDDAGAGLPASPSAIARRYADVLTDSRSRFADEFEQDSFVTQMRQLAQAQPAEHIVFRQSWRAEPVRYSLRLSDGGALVFADLRRVDSYRIEGRHALGFAGSQAAAYLPDPVHHWARLVYDHEVLLLVPADGKALAIGQFGGLVGATGR